MLNRWNECVENLSPCTMQLSRSTWYRFSRDLASLELGRQAKVPYVRYLPYLTYFPINVGN